MFVPQPGLIVGERYSLTEVIGRGGMGEVWKAHDQELDNVCAVKFVLQHLAADRGIRERFAREAKAVARLRSPHVVNILGVGEIETTPYIAMELLDGETLAARLGRIGRLHPAVTLKMVEQIAEALEGAHSAGIVHRDLKPDNIWFWSGNKVFVKVLDFGVAKTGMTTQSLQTATGALVGTPQYMSPEQALGNRDIDQRSDLWSLAVITIECLTGKRPFESAGLGDLLIKIVSVAPPSLRDLAPDLPTGLEDWWRRALARDPRDRFHSASELVEALRPELAKFEAAWASAHGVESVRPAGATPAESGAWSGRSGGTALVGRGFFTSSRSTTPLHAPSGLAPSGLTPSNVASPAPSLGPIAMDGPALGSVPARPSSSVGPISSQRNPLLSRGGRQRTALIAGGVLVLGALVTASRLLLRTPADDVVAGSTAPASTPRVDEPGEKSTAPTAKPNGPAEAVATAPEQQKGSERPTNGSGAEQVPGDEKGAGALVEETQALLPTTPPKPPVGGAGGAHEPGTKTTRPKPIETPKPIVKPDPKGEEAIRPQPKPPGETEAEKDQRRKDAVAL